MHGVPEEKWLPVVDSAVSAGREVFFLTSGAADIRRLGSFLVSLRRSGGVSEYAVHVGFQLSYPDEVVKTLTPEECMEIDGQGLWCGMLIPKKGN
jgi:precorrin-6Y C5,15-methyltransferase (decarboxylating)